MQDRTNRVHALRALTPHAAGIRIPGYDSFAVECCRPRTQPATDGNLGGWGTQCPIPLIAKNQLTALHKATSEPLRTLTRRPIAHVEAGELRDGDVCGVTSVSSERSKT